MSYAKLGIVYSLQINIQTEGVYLVIEVANKFKVFFSTL